MLGFLYPNPELLCKIYIEFFFVDSGNCGRSCKLCKL